MFWSSIQYHHCKRYGHIKAHYWSSDKPVEHRALMVVEEKEKEVTNLFMVLNKGGSPGNLVWIINNGCSNHMTGEKSHFINLDESQKLKVRLGNDKELAVEGRGNVAISIDGGRVKLLHNVQFATGLATTC